MKKTLATLLLTITLVSTTFAMTAALRPGGDPSPICPPTQPVCSLSGTA